MGTWFRDYVYFPLGGSRVKTKFRMLFNLFVVWVLTGIWHGANWTFLLWGIMYFVLLSAEKMTGLPEKMKGFGHIWTMFFVVVGWVIFRSDTVGVSVGYIKAMLGISASEFIDKGTVALLGQYWVVLLLGILFSVFSVNKHEKSRNSKLYEAGYVVGYSIMIVLSCCAVIKGGNDPFIYFNF